MKMPMIAALIMCAILAGCGKGYQSGTGRKIGQVIQLGQHGAICPSYEGKLVRGGFNTGSGVAGGVFDFSVDVDNLDLFEKLTKAMESQQEIEINYSMRGMSGPCTMESNHFVTGFRVMGETTPSVVVKTEDLVAEKKKLLMKQLRELEEIKP